MIDVADERARLDAALCARTMREPLTRAFALAETTPCHVVDAKYRPGSSCVVLYRLGAHHATGVVDFGVAGELGGGRPVAGVRAYLFPDDPSLPGLRAAIDPHRVPAELFGPGSRRARINLVRYRPGRATLRFEVSGLRSTVTLIGKVYGDHQKAAAVYREGIGLVAALDDQGPVGIAKVEGILADIPLVLWQFVPGADIVPALKTAKGPQLVDAAARALAVLHGAPLVSERRRPVTAELERLHSRAVGVERVAPSVGHALLGWATTLMETVPDSDIAAVGLVHGDCKPSQFLLTGPRLSLLDFDHCGVGDPASDVGAFLASLRQLGLSRLEQAFFDAYTAASTRSPLDRRRVLWFESVALLRKALRAFARAPRSQVPARLAVDGAACLAAGAR